MIWGYIKSKRPRITKILNYIIEVTSYDGPTVNRTLVFDILTFGRRRNCQTLAHIRLTYIRIKKTTETDEFMVWFHLVFFYQSIIYICSVKLKKFFVIFMKREFFTKL